MLTQKNLYFAVTKKVSVLFTAFLLIWLFMENTFKRIHSDKGNILRPATKGIQEDSEMYSDTLPNILSKAHLQSRLDLIRLFAHMKFEYGAEVGVWKGDFSNKTLEIVQTLKHYYLVDPWRHLEDWKKPFNKDNLTFTNIYKEATSKTKLGKYGYKVIVLRGMSEEVHGKVPENQLDYVYIDGDHTQKGICKDLYIWYNKVKPGGLICGDDYVNSHQHGTNFAPTKVKLVVDDFVKRYLQGNVYNLGLNQFAFIKPTRDKFTNESIDVCLKR